MCETMLITSTQTGLILQRAKQRLLVLKKLECHDVVDGKGVGIMCLLRILLSITNDPSLFHCWIIFSLNFIADLEVISNMSYVA